MQIETLEPWPVAAQVVRHLGGRASRARILEFTTRHRLDAAVASGRLVRATRGSYVLKELPPELVVAATCRGVVSHESAAIRLGLETVFAPAAVHVTVGRGTRPRPVREVVVHRGELADADVDAGVTSPVRTVLDCAATMPFREALAVADSAARRYPELRDPLLAAAHAQPVTSRARCIAVVEASSALAENPFESALRGSLWAAGLVDFVPQVRIATRREAARVDLADVRRRIVLEADSFAWHGNRQALAADCRRYAELTRAGWRVLRFAWEHVMYDDAWIVEVVRDVVRGGWVV